MTKQEIRKEYLQLRLQLPDDQYSLLNQNLCSNFFTYIDLSKVKTLHIFIPIVAKKEPDTWLIIEQLKMDHPQIRISIPRMTNGALINYYFEGKNQLKENQWGISEPVFGKVTPADQIDLVIVPLVSFDKKGNRIGYGKGFYDKFLAQCRADCKKVGLSFFPATDRKFPVEQFDIPLHAVVTPHQLIQF